MKSFSEWNDHLFGDRLLIDFDCLAPNCFFEVHATPFADLVSHRSVGQILLLAILPVYRFINLGGISMTFLQAAAHFEQPGGDLIHVDNFLLESCFVPLSLHIVLW